MKYNKGMLSVVRGQREEKIDKTNLVAYATRLLNLFHTIDASAYPEEKKISIRKELKDEIYSLKNRMPKWFANKITFWIENKEEWMERD